MCQSEGHLKTDNPRARGNGRGTTDESPSVGRVKFQFRDTELIRGMAKRGITRANQGDGDSVVLDLTSDCHSPVARKEMVRVPSRKYEGQVNPWLSWIRLRR